MRASSAAILLIPALLLGACAADNPQNPDDGGTVPAASDDSPDGDSARAAQAARIHLAERLGADPGDIAVEEIEARDWSDSCLGLGGPAESCLAAITPGFSMTLVHQGAEHRYRTDIDGSAVRAE